MSRDELIGFDDAKIHLDKNNSRNPNEEKQKSRASCTARQSLKRADKETFLQAENTSNCSCQELGSKPPLRKYTMLRVASQFQFNTILAAGRGIAGALAVIFIAAAPCMAVPLAAPLSDQTSKSQQMPGDMQAFNRFAFAVEASHWRLPLPPPDRAVYVEKPLKIVSTDDPEILTTGNPVSSDAEKTLASTEPASNVQAVEAPSKIKSRPKNSKRYRFKSSRGLGYPPSASKKTQALKRKPEPVFERSWKMRALFPDS